MTRTAAVDRRGADLATFEGGHVRAVDRAAVQVQLAAGVQLVEQPLVQGRPDASLHRRLLRTGAAPAATPGSFTNDF